ncbi:MAG TPA: hydrogen gas-evolving membrane-bound hydrogenase subunit E [Acidimicrobiales bacterium]|nr:hydrogen gas-evolving membrane-bound hydrogenase subunit E [Acidimicrobiales bacterium]
MTALLAAHLVVGLGLVAWGRQATRVAVPLAAAVPAATVAWLAVRAGDPLAGRPVTEEVAWVPRLGVDMALRLDGFAVLFAGLVSGMGVLVVAYAGGYLARGGAGQGRLLGLLVLFAGSMLGLVLADDLVVLFGFWELTSVTSFLLIGIEHQSVTARAAALQALLVTTAGGLALLAGVVLLGQAAGGTFRLSEVLADPPGGTATTVGLVLVAVGAFTKSAQVPFHAWLPGAMVAPTPVSAYLHSATMVKAGVYVIGRFAPAFATVWIWRPLVVGVGLATMVVGGLRALRQTDLKLLLAFGTISQLGFMVVLFGLGTADTVVDAGELVLAHALFKAALFMVVGALDHQLGTRDLRHVPRPGRGWAPLTVVTVVSSASMAGVPLLFGFVAKEDAFAGLEAGRFAEAGAVLAAVVVASVLTAAYSLRFAWGALGYGADRSSVGEAPPPPGPGLVVPAVSLATLTVVLGVAPALAEDVVGGVGRALSGAVAPPHLAPWHGLGLPLVLSAVVLAAGVGLFLARSPVDRVLALGHRVPSGGEVYLLALRRLNVLADRVTAVAQSGSLPVYTGVILTTAAVLPTAAFLLGDGWQGWPAVVGPAGQVVVCVAVLVFGAAAGAVHRRFSAALLLGAAGYAMAGLFVVRGGADLALTQVAIETLTTVVFVLVLRRLPDRFESRSSPGGRAVRLAVAATVGTAVFVLALAAGGQRAGTPVSADMVARAVPDGGGRNVVNVILVDFRGIDTMGEVTVLAAAAIGSVALARAGRRPRRTGSDDPTGPSPAEAAGGPRLRRLVVVDVAVRVVFSAVVVGSIYLLFAGHNQPGGGFVGGIVAGAAVALLYVAGGIDDVRRVSRARPWTVLGGGLLLSALTVVVPLALGGAPLEAARWEADLWLLGHVKATSALAFDAGVYLLVVGLVLMVFESFGDDPRRLAHADADRAVHDSTAAPSAHLPEVEEVPGR